VLLMRALVATMALSVVGGCGGEAPGPCVGDCTLPIVLEPVGMYTYESHVLADGDPVSIQPPLQGGYVMYVGVRAKNVHGLTAQLSAAIIDVDSPQVVAIEQRPVRLLDDGTGWASPDIASQDLANVPVCSRVTGPEDFDRSPWRLEARLTDSDGRTAVATVVIEPRCADDYDYLGCRCACEARAGGEPCTIMEQDAGVGALDAAR